MRYVETRKTITEDQFLSGKYHNVHESPDGELWIRTGLNANYYDNGIMAWGFLYNDFGELIESYPQRRSDGSYIQN